MSDEKHCSSCDCTYPATELYFNKRTGASDGLQSWCRNCSYRRSTGQIVQRLDTGIDTPVLTAKEAAMYCRCSETTIHRLCREDTIPFNERTGRRTFLKHELIEWLSALDWNNGVKSDDKLMQLINEL